MRWLSPHGETSTCLTQSPLHPRPYLHVCYTLLGLWWPQLHGPEANVASFHHPVPHVSEFCTDPPIMEGLRLPVQLPGLGIQCSHLSEKICECVT